MKIRLALFISVCVALLTVLRAQDGPPLSKFQQVAVRPPEQLEQLLGPIALYPDALVALIMPASTAPSDIVLASRYLAAGGAPENIANQPWDESVKALAHYPEIIKWMDDNLGWTKELGETFLAQPADMMKAVQRLRAQAIAAGTLVNTPQQQIVREGEDICIVPAQREVIYVPRYDPTVVYVRSPVYYSEPVVSFGIGFAIGSWLAFDCDWGQRVIWVGRRGHDWRAPATFTRPHYVSDPDWRHWKPSARMHPPRADFYQPRHEIVRPRPFTGVSPHLNRPQENPTDHVGVRDNREIRNGRDGQVPRPERREYTGRDAGANARHSPAAAVNSAPEPSPVGPTVRGVAPAPQAPAMRPARSHDEPRNDMGRDNSARRPGSDHEQVIRQAPSPARTPEFAPPHNSQPAVQPTHEPKTESKDRDKDRDKNLN